MTRGLRVAEVGRRAGDGGAGGSYSGQVRVGAASPHSNCAAVQLKDHIQSGLQEECWRIAERWCTLISVKQALSSDWRRGRETGQKAEIERKAPSPIGAQGLREFCRSAGAVPSAGSPESWHAGW